MTEVGPTIPDPPLLRWAKCAFFLQLFLLAWMKHGIPIEGLEAFPVDLLFLVTTALWAAALVARQARLRLHPAFLLLALYFAALALSAVFSVDRQTSAFKLLTQIYLLTLPVLAFNLVTTIDDLKRAFAWWLAAAVAVGAYGVATVLLFPFFGYHSFLSGPLHHFGTLPPGFYPRIELTFEYPAMLASYLGVSLMFVLVAERLGWLARTRAIACAAVILVSALFALTPGFGGVIAMLGLWIWYCQRETSPKRAVLALAGVCGVTVLEILVAAVTPVLHPTAPFLIHVPGLAKPIAPAVRLMVWMAAAKTFLASPIVGHGIGVDPVSVPFQSPEETMAYPVTDAHNLILSIAAQCGIVGVAALVAIVWFVIRQARAAATPRTTEPLLFALSIAWLSGFVIEGLVGSFEDARHLWILLGFILAASRFRTAERAA
jgi:O-antigen ligase